MRCHVMPCYAMPCHAMPCHTTPHQAKAKAKVKADLDHYDLDAAAELERAVERLQVVQFDPALVG